MASASRLAARPWCRILILVPLVSYGPYRPIGAGIAKTPTPILARRSARRQEGLLATRASRNFASTACRPCDAVGVSDHVVSLPHNCKEVKDEVENSCHAEFPGRRGAPVRMCDERLRARAGRHLGEQARRARG